MKNVGQIQRSFKGMRLLNDDGSGLILLTFRITWPTYSFAPRPIHFYVQDNFDSVVDTRWRFSQGVSSRYPPTSSHSL